MNEIHGWEEKLEEGDKYEQQLLGYPFFKTHPVKKIPYELNLGDFLHYGRFTQEIKTESGYTHQLKHKKDGIRLTSNLFIEKFSKENSRTLGGVWRAEIEKVIIYSHYFPHENILYNFNTPQLLNYIKSLEHKGILSDRDLIRVKNKGYWTLGYKIPLKQFTNAKIAIGKIDLNTGIVSIYSTSSLS